MCIEYVSLSRGNGFLDYFFVHRDAVFVIGFWVSSGLYPLKISASDVELGYKDDFWDNMDSVFDNGFSVSSSLYALKMSAATVELGFFDDFWVPGT